MDTPYSTRKNCINCLENPSVAGLEFCSKRCKAEAEAKLFGTTRRTTAPVSRRQLWKSNSAAHSPSPAAASALCENCYARPKSQEADEDGSIITHPYCGLRCSSAASASQRSIFPISAIPAPAAASVDTRPLALRVEGINTPIRRNILLRMQERWKSDKVGSPQLTGVYRIDLSGHVYRRFDLSLEMNDGCPVTTTYYGGAPLCSIATEKDPAPCQFESCEVCDALRNLFGNLPYGPSSGHGAYGPGLYTYRNPALAHDAAVPSDDRRTQDSNYVLIQCRVVTNAKSGPNSNPFTGFVDDAGVVFCAQPTAVIPTHLLTYRVARPSDPQQTNVPVNTAAQSGQTIAAQAVSPGSSGQPNSFTAGPSMAPGGHTGGTFRAGSIGAALAGLFMPRASESRMNEDDFDYFNPDPNLARLQEQDTLDEDDDDPYNGLPERPPGSRLPDLPPRGLPDLPPRRRGLPPKSRGKGRR